MICWLGGCRKAVVDGDLHERSRRRGELAHLVSMTDGSSSNSVLEEEATTVSLSLHLDSDRSGSTVASHGKKSGSGKAEMKTGSVVLRRDEVEQGSSGDAHAWDKDGWSTWDGGDWRCTITTASPRVVSHTRAL
jgi:hypothetical protein